MQILGLIEVHPFDGTEGFVCLRIDNHGTLFDLPIDQEQLEIIVSNTQNRESNDEIESEDQEVFNKEEEFSPSPINQPQSNEDVLYLENARSNYPDTNTNYAEYSMGETLWDDDL